MTPYAVIFDFDGTLVDSNEEHIDAWHEAFHSFGHEVPRELIRPEIGKGGDHLVPALLGDDIDGVTAASLAATHDDIFCRIARNRCMNPFAGVVKLLDTLQRRWLTTALATSSNRRVLEATQQAAGIDILGRFDLVATADRASHSKPSPDIILTALEKLKLPARLCLYIGDTVHDAEAALSAGVPFIGLSCGGCASELELMIAGAIAVWPDPTGLLGKLDEALGLGELVAELVLNMYRVIESTNRPTPMTIATKRKRATTATDIAGLVYGTDQEPGIRREAVNGGFIFLSLSGRQFKSARSLKRFQMLAIPPAWRDVWISPNPLGHIQATGRDQRGRKQYIYHPRWRTERDQAKYDQLIAFAERLGALRRRIDRDLRNADLDREKILATVVSLLQLTFIRVGNEEYAKQNRSYGLTTLRNHHVSVNGKRVRFQFRGKSGVKHTIDLTDRRFAKIIKRCQDLPGEELFQFEREDGQFQPISSADVNEYVRDAMGRDFTAKDFRTWAGTVLAGATLRDAEPFKNETQARRDISAAVEVVAKQLGNTKTVCRQCYIHPTIIEAYRNGRVHEPEGDLRSRRAPSRLSADERAVYRLLCAASV